jgi:hypothetical protein
VPKQQPLPQCQQDKGADCGLKEKHAPILIVGAGVERVESFKVLCVHITKELTWSTHTHTIVKRARQHLFPFRRLEKIWHGPSDPQIFIPLPHWEHLGWLHHRLVWQLKGTRRQDATEDVEYGPVHHWGWAPCHQWPLNQAVSEAQNVFKNSNHPSHRLFPLPPYSKSGTNRTLNSFTPNHETAKQGC